jgi:hypothetical protein
MWGSTIVEGAECVARQISIGVSGVIKYFPRQTLIFPLDVD